MFEIIPHVYRARIQQAFNRNQAEPQEEKIPRARDVSFRVTQEKKKEPTVKASFNATQTKHFVEVGLPVAQDIVETKLKAAIVKKMPSISKINVSRVSPRHSDFDLFKLNASTKL